MSSAASVKMPALTCSNWNKESADATGLSTLKVGYNRVHGYYIEISRSQSEQAPDAYQRRQTLKNVERFITPELKTFEDKALSSKSRALAREKLLYEQIVSRVAESLLPLQTTATALCDLDVLACFAERSISLNLCRPKFTDGTLLQIEGGRTPRLSRAPAITLLFPTILSSTTSAGCYSLPDPTWGVNRPTCAKMR